MKTRLYTAVATVAVAALTTAGCSSAIAGSAGSAGAGSAAGADPVEWSGKVCSALSPITDLAKNTAAGAGSSDIGAFLGKAADGLKSSVAALGAVGPSPISGGDEIVNRFKDGFSKMETAIEQAKAKLDAVGPDPRKQAAVLPEALAPLSQFGTLMAPLSDLKSNAELDKAFAAAPSCTTIH